MNNDSSGDKIEESKQKNNETSGHLEEFGSVNNDKTEQKIRDEKEVGERIANNQDEAEREDLMKNGNSSALSSNVLIIHGQPGSGKSALSAKVFMECTKKLRNAGHFIFAHGVDTFPGSTDLPSMLRRLHLNLKVFSNGSSYDSDTLSELRKNHIEYLESIAKDHPKKLFLVIVDAVNQFSSHFNALKMWWVKLRNPPTNLCVIISTLEEENKTFENALKMAPNALKVKVPPMTEEDARNLVASLLGRYNKKLTTTNDPNLGNQMERLVEKSKSPLYLTAATHALRMYGVYEKLSDYIEQLPCDIPDLFNFLLDGWVSEYGRELIRDVCLIIYLSKYGILENTLNEVLTFIEESEGVIYKCNFSRVYDSVREFLSSEGGGHLRFFHEQLEKVIRKKFIVANSVEQRIHRLLSQFFVEKVMPQLREFPVDVTSPDYKDCLLHLVYHQINAITEETKSNEVFINTLYNIYFIRERVKEGQQDVLLNEYNSAIMRFSDAGTLKALKSWRRFAKVCIPYIERYGSSLSLYNIAMQQIPTSIIVSETKKHSDQIQHDGFQLIWTNPPTADVEDVLLTYTTEHCVSCYVAVVGGVKLLCVNGVLKLWLYELDTGVLLQEVEERCIFSVLISPISKTFWCGGLNGYLSLFTIDEGDMVWKKDVGVEGKDDQVCWLCDIDGKVLCGTTYGNISILTDSLEYNKLNLWNTEEDFLEDCCYAYHSGRDVVLSGHKKGIVKVWKMSGEIEGRIVFAEGEVRQLTLKATDDVVAVVFYDRDAEQAHITAYTIFNKFLTYHYKKKLFKIPDICRNIVQYNQSGGNLLTCSKDMKTVLVFNTEGKLVNTVHGNKSSIHAISSVPGTGDLVTAGGDGDGCKLLEIPEFSDVESEIGDEMTTSGESERSSDYVTSCGVLAGGEEFFTITKQNVLQVWNVETSQLIRGTKVAGNYAVAHPTEQLILCSMVYHCPDRYLEKGLPTNELWLVRTSNLETISNIKVGGRVKEVRISPLGDKSVVGCRDSDTCHVLDIPLLEPVSKRSEVIGQSENSNTSSTTENLKPVKIFQLSDNGVRYKMERAIHSSDIHSDGVRAVSGGYGVDLWNIKTGEKIETLVETNWLLSNIARKVKFVKKGLIYQDGEGSSHLLTLDGTVMWTAKSDSYNFHYYDISLILKEQYLLTSTEDNTIRVWDMNSNEAVYTFWDQTITKMFTCVLELPSCVVVYNADGNRYIFKTSNQI